jgi:hypothetical protein
MNGLQSEQVVDHFKQQNYQGRRFTMTPGMNRFMNQAGEELLGGMPPHPHLRRHSVAVPERKLSTKFLSEGVEKMGLDDPSRLEEINNYFENSDNRTRAWVEAGRNLELNASTTTGNSPVSPVTSLGNTHRWPLYVVEFKAGRTDFFYLSDEAVGTNVEVGDLAIVEADRGKDLGKVLEANISSMDDLYAFQATHIDPLVDSHNAPGNEIRPKRLYRLAQSQDVSLLLTKSQDEAKAMGVCQVKIRQKKLPMEIVDAEYQWYLYSTFVSNVIGIVAS